MYDKDKIDILLKRYSFIREEIVTSFRNQQNTLNWSAIAFGVMLVFVVNLWQISISLAFIFFILILPTTSILFLNLYLSEIKRMGRSGHYLYELENELGKLTNIVFKKDNITLSWWEHWLREKDEKNQTRQITLGYKSGLAVYLGALIFSHLISIFMIWIKMDSQIQKIANFFNCISVTMVIKIVITTFLLLFNIIFLTKYYKNINRFVFKEPWKKKFEENSK